MDIIQTRQTETIRTIGSQFTAQMPVGPVETTVTFSDGTRIMKYGETNHWFCNFDVNGVRVEVMVTAEELLDNLPKIAAEELIFNMNTFVQL